MFVISRLSELLVSDVLGVLHSIFCNQSFPFFSFFSFFFCQKTKKLTLPVYQGTLVWMMGPLQFLIWCCLLHMACWILEIELVFVLQIRFQFQHGSPFFASSFFCLLKYEIFCAYSCNLILNSSKLRSFQCASVEKALRSHCGRTQELWYAF